MLSGARRGRILSQVQGHGAMSVRDLALQFNVSESTIRRDLELLDRDGDLTRTHGGAVVNRAEADEVEAPFSARDAASDPLRERVAAAAATLVPDGAAVLLDIGTTTTHVARALRGRRVTVMTTNLAVLDVLRDDEAVDLVLLGGLLRRNYQSLVGHLTELALAEVSADVAFLSCTGVRPDGRVVDNMAIETPAKRAMMAAAGEVVLLAPAPKLPGTGAIRICDLAEVDVLITTDGADDATLAHTGGRVLLA